MNLAIITPNKDAYSETFIQAGIERLPDIKAVYFGGWQPHSRIGRGRFYPPSDIHLRIRNLFMRLAKEPPSAAYNRIFARVLKADQIDVVLAHYALTGVEIMAACKKAGVQMVVHCHGMDAHQQKTLKQYGSKYPILGKRATAVIAVSEKMRSSLVQLGVPEGKIKICHYGVDCSAFRLTDATANPPVFLSVGRFVDKKAPYMTLLAFRKVYEQASDARLVMIGDGLLYETCNNLAVAFGIEGAVEFTGPLPHDKVANRMRASRAYVQHSIEPIYGPSAGDSEGTPVAILEASASGLPVISTKHAGINEAVIDGKTGFLVAERDVDAMAEKMLHIINNPQQARSMGEAGRRHIEQNYSMEKYISSLQKILEQAMLPPDT